MGLLVREQVGMELAPDTVLQLAPGIRTRSDATGHVLVDSNVGTIIDIGPRGFGILSLFSQPIRARATRSIDSSASTAARPTSRRR